jgi:hypothetical protein
MCDEREKANGLDMKITAVQLYVQALEDLELHLEEAKQTPALLVATLCLMAYFEVSGAHNSSIQIAHVVVLICYVHIYIDSIHVCGFD